MGAETIGTAVTGPKQAAMATNSTNTGIGTGRCISQSVGLYVLNGNGKHTTHHNVEKGIALFAYLATSLCNSSNGWRFMTVQYRNPAVTASQRSWQRRLSYRHLAPRSTFQGRSRPMPTNQLDPLFRRRDPTSSYTKPKRHCNRSSRSRLLLDRLERWEGFGP